MYIQKITLRNYRNFNDFTMKFRKGLNVIIGSNNSGKTAQMALITFPDASREAKPFSLAGNTGKALSQPLGKIPASLRSNSAASEG